jgi:hypothetical protein
MNALALQFDGIHTTQDYRQMAEKIEWIRTSEAAEILDVKSTQGVLTIVRGEKEPYNWIVRYWNVGTDAMPRYMLAKDDIIALAKQRKSKTNL